MGNSKTANRLAKNTFFLYLRSFILLAISIYSSRVVLNVLGVEDYGLYNLVGGVVALFSSLRVVFTSAIQRFINYTRGEGNEEMVKHVFSLSFIIQILLAVFFCIVVETFGLWFIPNKLVIPEYMLETAMFVFHCSIAASVVYIVSIPFNALVIANEKMNIYAYISISEALLRLLAVFLLIILPFIKLRSYAVLILIIQIFFFIVYYCYCKRFPECKIEKYWDKTLFKRLASFSGWNFFGNMVFSLVNEGLNFILNLFGGLVTNAARGIMTQVRNAIETLSSNLFMASQPFIMQQAATVKRETLFDYICSLSRVIYYVILVTVIPLFVYTEQVLSLWLVETPPFTVAFVRVILIFELIRSLHAPVEMLFLSVGKLKRYQITELFVLFLSLPFSYLLLKKNFPVYTAYIVMTIVEFINLISILFVAKKETGFSVMYYFRVVLSSCFLSFLIVAGVGCCFYLFLCNFSILMSLICMVFCALISSSCVYLFILSENEKDMILSAIKKKNNKS